MGEATQAPGFFGKLPSHGDFVTRRLPPAVRLCFDNWLQSALVQSRLALGEAWLPAWLGSPLWRFAIAAGVCGDQGWTGVMMPSHDRVGRCFPLLVMAGGEGTLALRECLTTHERWFIELENLALSTLEEGFSLDAFDASLMARDGAPLVRAGTVPMGDMHKAAVEAWRAGEVPTLAHEVLGEECSAWWTEGSQQVAPCLAVCRGLPAPAGFAALLDGRWTGRGWT